MTEITRRTAVGYTVLAALTALSSPRELAGQAVASATRGAAPAKGFTVEYYYKIRWGAYSEFRRLYVKNHLPILRRYQTRGFILAMSATTPITHVGEGNRWDMRFDITWKDAALAFEEIPDEDAIVRELFPDQETFLREEQRRFELIVEHLDLPVLREDVSTW
ncbi:MAG: hypothetical protein ACKVS7_07660 [Gemmatimonadaceae bacterium]